MLTPLESTLHDQLLPKLVPHAVSDIIEELFSFPVRFDGLGICDLISASEQQYDFSKALLQGFVDLVLSQKSALCPKIIHHQNNLFRHLCFLREQSLSAQLQSTISNCPPPLHWASGCWMLFGWGGCLHFHWSGMVLSFKG